MLETPSKRTEGICSETSDLFDLTSIFSDPLAPHRYYSVISPVLSDLDLLPGDVVRLPVFNYGVSLDGPWIVCVVDEEGFDGDLLLRHLSTDGVLSTKSSVLKEPLIHLSTGVRIVAGCPISEIACVVRALRPPFYPRNS